MTWPELTGIILGVVALGGMLAQWRGTKSQIAKAQAEAQRYQAEAEKAEADTETELLPHYKTEVGELRREVKESNEDHRRELKEMGESYRKEIEIMQASMKAMGVDLQEVKEELYLYKEGTKILVAQLTQNAIRPLWKPPDWIG